LWGACRGRSGLLTHQLPKPVASGTQSRTGPSGHDSPALSAREGLQPGNQILGETDDPMPIRLGNFRPDSEDFVLQIEVVPKQLGNFLRPRAGKERDTNEGQNLSPRSPARSSTSIRPSRQAEF
jgi:hypothetical protein